MFHKFSAAPGNARGHAKAAGSTSEDTGNTTTDHVHDATSNESTVIPPVKRQKTTRACDRCRLQRIKCGEQKPCAQCVGVKAQCVVSYGPLRPAQPDDGNSQINHARLESPSLIARSESDHGLRSRINANDRANTVTTYTSPMAPLSSTPLRTKDIRDGTWATKTPPDDVPGQRVDPSLHTRDFFASGKSASSHASGPGSSLFPKLPHPTVPSGEPPVAPTGLSRSQWTYYLWLFWDMCHPLVPIMSETEFADLNKVPPSTMLMDYSEKSCLIDAMIALGVQNGHLTGLAERILVLQQPLSSETGWPGFEYFDRCRGSMRTNKGVALDGLRSHALMVFYLMKGHAFHDAYNLLGITVRKAYIANIHRVPSSQLPEAERTARMQLWSTLFSLDLQCSLQLGMPPAIQKSLVKCPLTTEDTFTRFVFASSRYTNSISPYEYSYHLVNLAVNVIDTSICVSTADLEDDSDDSSGLAALEHHALSLSSALQNLDVWHNQLPSELLLTRSVDESSSTEELDINRNLAQPRWLQQQAVLIELYYHNVYILIQRPLIRFRYASAKGAATGKNTLADVQQSHMEPHTASAFHHATIIVDTIFTVCCSSDIPYGWSEVLQPLWNATLTIIAYAYIHIYAELLRSVVSQALSSLTRAQAVIELFSSTCPSARSAKDILQPLINSLQNMSMQDICAPPTDDPMSWDLFTSLLEEPQITSVGFDASFFDSEEMQFFDP